MSKKLLKMCVMVIMMVISMSAWALSEVNGVYQIGTAQDFLDFAALVNGGDTYACAELTADIDLGTDGTMIGSDANRFRGIFDGKGHSITVNSFPKAEGQAIFRNMEGNALIQNLKVQGTITTSMKEAAGIAAWGRGTIRNCWIDLTVVSSVAGDGTHAGIVAVASEGLVIENCLSHITINGANTENCGGICGWADGNVTVANSLVINEGTLKLPSDCGTISRNSGKLTNVDLTQYNGGDGDGYNWRPRGANYNNYATNAWGNTSMVTIISAADLSSGKVCYQLNNDQTTIAWVQNIGSDDYPVPAVFGTGKKQVYASGATGCNGKSDEALTYSNSGTVQATAHTTDKFGICTTCGHMELEKLPRDITDNSFIAKTKEDLDWLEGRNRVNNGGWFNISLANDIEYEAVPGQLIFNNDNWYGGNFDGRGHALTIEFTDAPEAGSLFPNFRGTLKNTIFHGNITTSNKFIGTVTGHVRDNNVVIKNVYSDVNINPTFAGDNTIGGLIGVGDTNYRLENAIYNGTISGTDNTECLAGICGWSAGNGTMVNVAFLGSIENGKGDSQLISRNKSKVIPTNCYFLNDCGFYDERFTKIDADDVESGKLAFLLNGQKQGGEDFYQVIGTDDVPMPIAKEGAKVYTGASSYLCDGTPLGNVTYTNVEGGANIPPHTFVGGFCEVCNHVDENYVTPTEDGWYELGSADELIWWSHYAAEVNLGANARLKADIDMSEKTTPKEYAIVGNESTPFYGNFDGQFHTISNFQISYPGQRGVGLIAVMNSRANKKDGMSDSDARNAEGVFIKNVVLDESCKIEGLGYCGIVGMTAEWAGHVTFLNVGMDGDVNCTDGANAGGVLGCVMGSTCHITIDNCYMTGNCTGPNENGSFSGWLGDHCDIQNCYAIGTVEHPDGEAHKYFARYGSAKITNCYTLNGGTIDDADHQIYRIEEGDIASGKFTYLLNGKQFRNSLFYQDLEIDEHPVANPAHGTIVYAAGKYMTANAETLPEVVVTISEFYTEKANETIAYSGSIEAMNEKIEALDGVTDINGLADALDTIYVYEAAVDASAKVYKKYQDKCEETKAYLADHDDFEGGDRDELEEYLESEYIEIWETHELPDSLIEQEITRVDEWLSRAIQNGYLPGTDVTKMLVNPDFSEGKDKGWEGEAMATGHATVERDGGNLYGVESWSSQPFAITQTKTGMKPGYYLVGVNGAYRPQNDRYSYNYAAQISANGVINYLQTVRENPVNAEDAIDGENANLDENKTPDLGISDDGITTEFSQDTPPDAYVVQGPYGLAIAASAGRYQNYIACEVGADSVLTIAIANPHSKVGVNEWTGVANVRLTYLGTDEDDAASVGLTTALESQMARANTILTLYESLEGYEEDAAKAPNYPADLKESLEAAVAEAEAAESPEDKWAAIQALSQLFQNIYAGKQAYIKILGKAKTVESVLQMLDTVLSEDEYESIYNDVDEIYAIYGDGAFTLQEAQEFDVAKRIPAVANIVAPQDENGTYQISAPMHMIWFSATTSNGEQKANALLTKDINMTGIPFTPIASGTRYNGVFDGQQYAITNLTFGSEDEFYLEERAALFNDIENGTVKNLKIQSTIYTSAKFGAGLSAYTRNARIQDCDVDVTIHSSVEGDGTHGGIVGVNETEGTVIENCKVHFVLDGENTNSWGGIFGWSTNKDEVKNTLIIAEIVNANLESSNSVSRNDGNCSCSNVFYTTKLNGANIGTFIEATDERFKSGELTWLLNGSSAEDAHWFQTLGNDDMPHLFSGSLVWKNGNEYLNSRPNIQLNAFASNLSTATNAEQVVVAYTLNAEAKSGAINFYAGGELKYSHVLKSGDLMAGGHEIAIDNSMLGVAAGTKMTYELDITGIGALEPTRIGEGYKVNSPYGLAVNNAPSSKGFGQIYVAESRPLEKGEGSICEQKPGALFAFDATFKPINALDGTPGFYGGLDIKDNKNVITISGDYQFDLKNVRVSKDGRLFIARASGNSTSSVWEADPADLDKPWTPIFTGGELDPETGIVSVGGEEQNRPAVALAVEGEGENLKLTVLGAQRSDGAENFSDYKCFTYNLGTATSWTGAPSNVYEPLTGKYTVAPGHVGIIADNRGGLWYEQYRSNPKEEEPSIKHFDATGKEDYSNITTNTRGEAIAISEDGSILAIPMGANKVVIYETNYAPMANNEIFLDGKYNISVEESQITGMAFDYANNLYITSSASKTLNRYAIPSFTDNKCVTPAPEGFTVGTESGDPDAIKSVNGNTIANGTIYNIAGQRVSKAQKGIYVVDGKKVSVK
ncbi:MAG: hypothetical protein J6W52_04540 [Bacteroidaceae bacterium]|nr:hypothetical protein [Bacteroidaceae bacterium]